MKHRILRPQRGFSLIELMVAMTLGIFLVFGVTQVFVDSRRTYTVQEALSQMQENARVVMNIMSSDLRLAGFLGCGNLSYYEDISDMSVAEVESYVGPVLNIESGTIAYTNAGSIVAYQSTSAQSWHTNLPAAVQNGSGYSLADHSDALTLVGSSGCSAKLTGEMAALDSDVVVQANSCDFSEGRMVAVSSCASVDIFKLASGSSNTTLKHAENFSHKYAGENSYTDKDVKSSEAYLLESVTYFVAKEDGYEFPSLFMLSDAMGDDPVALIDGVESLQVTFGIGGNLVGGEIEDGTEEIATTYVNADQLTDETKERIITARVTLLLRSRGTVVDSAEYDFNSGGSEVSFNDGILRKSFTTTLRLRNRRITQI